VHDGDRTAGDTPRHPFFAMRAVPGLTLPMQERSCLVQLGAPGRWRWSSCCCNCACPLH
jgi:hypothetical protein